MIYEAVIHCKGRVDARRWGTRGCGQKVVLYMRGRR
jgi:hypothetical protein